MLVTALLKFILMDWFGLRAFCIVGISVFWAGNIYYRLRENGTILHLWGFRKKHFYSTLLTLTPFMLISIIISLIYSHYSNHQLLTWHIIPIFLLYPLWGIIQQFLMLAIVFRYLTSSWEKKVNLNVIVLLVSALFSFIHYPSLFLMAFTFFMELAFIVVYLKWRNLWAIGIAHGWIATFLLYFVIERDLWLELING